MDELYIKLRKHVYERLDIGRDVADSELYEVIDACIYDESRNNVISIRQKEELKQRLYNSIKKLDILQELLEDDSITEIMVNGSDSIFSLSNFLFHLSIEPFLSMNILSLPFTIISVMLSSSSNSCLFAVFMKNYAEQQE